VVQGRVRFPPDIGREVADVVVEAEVTTLKNGFDVKSEAGRHIFVIPIDQGDLAMQVAKAQEMHRRSFGIKKSRPD
jgi:hypothetical protein